MPYLRLVAWIIMFAIPVQGFAAASMLFCGQGTSHHAQVAAHQHPTGTSAHDHAQNQPEFKPALDNGAVTPGAGMKAPDLMHKCSVCASCCNAVALPQTALVVVPDLHLQADPADPLMAAYSRPLLVPDKPPRA
jgi:hypothetical protein